MHWMTVCAGCGQDLRVQDDHKGRYLNCPRCASPVPVRRPDPPRPPSWLWSHRRLLGIVGVLLLAGLLGASQIGRLRRPARPGPFPGQGSKRGAPGAISAGSINLASNPPFGEKNRPPAEEYLNLTEPFAAGLLDKTRQPPSLKPAGRIDSFLALTGDPETGVVLTSSADGTLRCYSSTFELRGTYRLAHVAYQMILDARRGRLYAASVPRGGLTLSPLGDRDSTTGHLHAYDVRDVLAGKRLKEELRPVQTRSLDAHIAGMYLSADGRWLCYLAESVRDVYVARTAAAALDTSEPRAHTLRAGGSAILVPATDGTLIGFTGQQLFRFDPQTAVLTRISLVSGTVAGMAAVEGNRLVVLERGGAGLHLLLVDLARRKVLLRRSADLPGRSYLRSEGARVYLGTSAVLEGQIHAFEIATGTPEFSPIGKAAPGGRRLLRGGLHVTPNGRYVLTENGHVFDAPVG